MQESLQHFDIACEAALAMQPPPPRPPPPPPVIPRAHDQAAHLVLQLEQLVVQIEEHMNPSLVGRTFVVVNNPPSQKADGDEAGVQHHTNSTAPPLGVSSQALRHGIRQCMPVTQIAVDFPAVTHVPAAAWRSPSLPLLEAYRNLAEKGPVQLLRRVVTGDGLELVEDSDHGELGKYNVVLQGTKADDDEEKNISSSSPTSSTSSFSVLLERAQELGGFLKAELGRLLGYRLVFGVGRTKEEACRNAKEQRVAHSDREREKTSVSCKDKVKEDGDNYTHQHEDHDAEESAGMPSVAAEAEVFTTKKRRSKEVGLEVEDKDEEDEEEEEEEEELEVAEFICETCRACFFEAVELVAHVQREHEENLASATTTATAPAMAMAQNPSRPSSFAVEAAVSDGSKAKNKRPRGMPAMPGAQAAPTPPLQLHGPGTVAMSEVLTNLTEAADITTFLSEIGPPPINFRGWPPPPPADADATQKE